MAEATDYYEIYLSNISRTDEATISKALFDLGALGVCENLEFEQVDIRFQPTVKQKDVLNLIAYFDKAEQVADLVETLQSRFVGLLINIKKEQSKDWLEEWKKGFEPFSLCEDAWVIPSWHKTPEGVTLPIYIDPGMAFGTGTHETTQLCSELICGLLKKTKVNTAFDLGTGTGILAILMSKLGVKDIGCCDIDPECRRVSQENFQNNGVSNCKWFEFLSEDSRFHDLIVANIIDGILLDLKSEIIRHCKAQTKLILSGILLEREEEFKKEFLAGTEYEVTDRRQKNEWCALLIESRKQ